MRRWKNWIRNNYYRFIYNVVYDLPAPWLWTEKGTYRSIKEIRAMVAGVVGRDKSREIIAYCGVGGYAGAWCFVLREILGYKNARVYDGAAQEWTADPKSPVSKYKWD